MIQENIINSNKEILEILKNKAKEGSFYLILDDIYFESIERKTNISRDFYTAVKRTVRSTSIIKYIKFNYKEDYTTKEMFELLTDLRKYVKILIFIFDPKGKECNVLFIANSEDFKLKKYINVFEEVEEM